MNDQLNAPQLALDLSMSKRHATHHRGDITVILTWLQHTGRPCLVLIPSFAPLHFDRITPCVVPIDNAWAWAEETGDGMHAATSSMIFAANLGFDASNPKGAFRVTSIIRDYLGDLLLMPPKPVFDQFVAAFTTLTNFETGQVTEAEVLDDV